MRNCTTTCAAMTATAFFAADAFSCAKNKIALILDAALLASIFVVRITLPIYLITLLGLICLMILVLVLRPGCKCLKDSCPHFA